MVTSFFFQSHFHLNITGHVGKQNIPIVCVVVEGGTNTIRTVLEYVTEEPPVNQLILIQTYRFWLFRCQL